MNRFARKMALLRGKRLGCYGADQPYLERAARAAAARRLRALVRRMVPALVLAPRWSEPVPFLDEVCLDLAIGEPAVHGRLLSLSPLAGRSAVQAWTWLAEALHEVTEVPRRGPALQALSREGFCTQAVRVLEQAERGPRRCLFLHHVEAAPVDSLQDLLRVYTEYAATRPVARQFTLVLCGSIEMVGLDLPEAARLILPDYHPWEAEEYLVGALGALEADTLSRLAERLGGVPALLAALEEGPPAQLLDAAHDDSSLWSVLGPLGTEVRRAVDLVHGREELGSRLEELSRNPLLPAQPADQDLFRAGLVRQERRGTQLRAPLLRELALS